MNAIDAIQLLCDQLAILLLAIVLAVLVVDVGSTESDTEQRCG
jgi:hypothetical protein